MVDACLNRTVRSQSERCVFVFNGEYVRIATYMSRMYVKNPSKPVAVECNSGLRRPCTLKDDDLDLLPIFSNIATC